jgi:hypothetical protein
MRHTGQVPEIDPIQGYAEGTHEPDGVIEARPELAFFPLIIGVRLDIRAAAQFRLRDTSSFAGSDQPPPDNGRLGEKTIGGSATHLESAACPETSCGGISSIHAS